jgi:beta-RFAP synthase
MFGFGRAGAPQFGGVGVMVEPPGVEVDIAPAERFSAHGDHAARARHFAELAAYHWQLSPLPQCRIDIRSPADHVGLGVGTQLGLSIAAGLRRYLDLPELSAESLATSVGRGLRSAVGTHGFQLGGLIVDAGKEVGEALGKLALRMAVPPSWRFVLVRAAAATSMSGDRESAAFAALPPVLERVTRELWRNVTERMLPALGVCNHVTFGEAVYHFGRLAGECFAAAQGGPFASAEIAELVAAIRAHGITGVGQSSWGPTIFAITADDAEAERLAHWLRKQACARTCEITIARPNNAGASIT